MKHPLGFLRAQNFDATRALTKVCIGFFLATNFACAMPLAMGPQLLTIARPYQANPQLMELLPVVVFRNQAGYLSYESAAQDPFDRPQFVRRISAERCQSGLQLPLVLLGAFAGKAIYPLVSLGLGEGTVRDVLADATASIEPGESLSNFTFDLKTVSVLAVWHQTCLVMTAAVTRSHPVEVLADPAVLSAPSQTPNAPTKSVKHPNHFTL